MTVQELITPETTVNEAIRRKPATLPFFKRAGIDACCGGPLAIAEAAARHRLDAEQLIADLNAAAGDTNG